MLPPESLAQAGDVNSVAWTADGKLLVSDGQAVRRMNVDGGQQTAMLDDSNSWIVDMARCGDRYDFSWAFHGGTRTGLRSGEPTATARTRRNLPREFSIISRRARRMELGFTMMNRKGRTR